MTIKAEVIEDSISSDGVRLVTVAAEYHNYVHPQVLTHRAMSRNAASTRAIPARSMRQWVANNMAMPIYWGSNKAGMVAGAQLEGWRLWVAKRLWRSLGRISIMANWSFEKLGLHKEVANRVFAPYIHTKVVITATEWDNMLILRDDDVAQHEIHDLVVAIRDAMNASTPRLRLQGEWHLPYITKLERAQWPLSWQMQVSVARCARRSYLNHAGKISKRDEDLNLYERLATAGHMSPFEHQACPAEDPTARSGNLVGWSQYRKMMPQECREGYDKLNRWTVIKDGDHLKLVVPANTQMVS